MDSAGMDYLKRNLGTLSLLAFALGAFLTELAGALPAGIGADITSVALGAMAVGRGIVLAAEALKAGQPGPPGPQGPEGPVGPMGHTGA